MKSSWKIYLLILLIIFTSAFISISLTSKEVALSSDASDYFKLAGSFRAGGFNLISVITQKSFVDVGYPLILSIAMRVSGDKNVVVFQLLNFAFWFFAVIFVYKALRLVTDRKRSFYGSLFMACSPIFLTFSTKLYSEPLASLGTAMIVYFLLLYKVKRKYLYLICSVLASIILFYSRSVYTLLFIPIFVLLITKRSATEFIILIAGAALLLTRLFFSYSGGRSNYNLAIQASKVYQSYSTLAACSLYNLSAPLGRAIFPVDEPSCIQKFPFDYLKGYIQNPYYIAGTLREDFNFQSWLKLVFSDPIKYVLVVASSMLGLIFIEGFYGNVTEHFLSPPAIIIFACVKLIFALYIWFNVFTNIKEFSRYGLKTALVSIFPLIYFFAVVGNFPVEQRYFYPLMPWLYFYAAFGKESIKKVLDILK